MDINILALLKPQIIEIKNFFSNHINNKEIHISNNEKAKLNISYNHAESPHAPITTATHSENGLFSKEDKNKLDGISEEANKYVHPEYHNADIILTDNNHQFVTKQNIQNWNSTYQQSTGYTDTKIAELINGAPSTLDTLGEIAQAMQEGGGISDALESAIGSKANQAELDSHTGNDTIHITASERTKWNNKMGNTEDASNTTVTFLEASDLSNINSGEKTGTIMGKVSKAISTLISHIGTKATADTFGHVKLSDTYKSAVSNGAAANGVGASQKALADAYSSLSSNLTDSLGGLTFGVDDNGNYGYKKAGADTVTPFKKDVALPNIAVRTTGINSHLILNIPDGYHNGTLQYSAARITTYVYVFNASNATVGSYDTGSGGSFSVSLRDAYMVQMTAGTVHSGNGDKSFTLLPDSQ